jgi:hypothetical protein
MLELAKKILTKVSFDAHLFQKELNKALRWITDADEIKKFQEWCIIEFGSNYPIIIRKTFVAELTK